MYSLANSALKQIEDMKYDTELNDFGVEDIVKIGIAFRQKVRLLSVDKPIGEN